MCRVLRLHPSGYYAWKAQPQSQRAIDDQRLLGLLKQAWLESGGVYGYRKLTLDMRDMGEQCSRHRVARLLRCAGIKSQRGYGKRPCAKGGVPAMEKLNKEKAALLYNEIDRNPLFIGTAAKEDRSLMNVCFVMSEGYKELEADFLKFASSKGLDGLKGHRSVGGFRASIYNAMPLEGVQALVDAMQEFEKNNAK